MRSAMQKQERRVCKQEHYLCVCVWACVHMCVCVSLAVCLIFTWDAPESFHRGRLWWVRICVRSTPLGAHGAGLVHVCVCVSPCVYPCCARPEEATRRNNTGPREAVCLPVCQDGRWRKGGKKNNTLGGRCNGGKIDLQDRGVKGQVYS